MSAEQSPVEPRDNDRPVEVTHIAEATFQDILDIGVGELAVRDATVIDRITEPGYDDFLDRTRKVARRLRNYTSRGMMSAKGAIYKDEFTSQIEALNTRLYDQVTDAFAQPRALLNVNPGLSPAMRANNRAQGRHTDTNSSKTPRVSMNFTFYAADVSGWSWRLYPSDVSPDVEGVDTPLTAGGCVILGDNARSIQDDFFGPGELPRTVSHEVVSPPSSWNRRGIKRVRILTVA